MLKALPIPDVQYWKEWAKENLCRYLIHKGIHSDYVYFIWENDITPRTLIDFSKESDASSMETSTASGKSKKKLEKDKEQNAILSYEWGFFIASGFENYIELNELKKIVKEFEV